MLTFEVWQFNSLITIRILVILTQNISRLRLVNVLMLPCAVHLWRFVWRLRPNLDCSQGKHQALIRAI